MNAFIHTSPLTSGRFSVEWHLVGECGKSLTTPYLMLIGEYHHTLDDKGRVSIPVKVRVACESGAILTRGLDHSLVVFPRDAWQTFVAGLQTLPWQQAETRALVRLFLAGASEVQMDRSGRMLVPEHLRAYAQLTKDVVFLGLGNRLEVWDSARWSQSIQDAETHADTIASALARLSV